MNVDSKKIVDEIEETGCALLADVFDVADTARLLKAIDIGIARGNDGNIKSSLGETYAARNLAELNPELLSIWKAPRLTELLSQVLGDAFGLVRILYFDKHPNRTWSLPWHKDMTIAVKDNSLVSEKFQKPTSKSGIDHVEAPLELLQQMLTLRIHLDAVTEDNGPLEVALGSHKNGKQAVAENRVHKVLCNAGDVLAIRPLVSHASGSSTEGTRQHRRILHLEFAAVSELPDGYQWSLFHR